MSHPLHDPDAAATVAAIGRAIADEAVRQAKAAGWSQREAGVLAVRAALELLLASDSPAMVATWLHRQADDVQRLGPTGGHC